MSVELEPDLVRLLCSGSWVRDTQFARTAYRDARVSWYRYRSMGVRLLRRAPG